MSEKRINEARVLLKYYTVNILFYMFMYFILESCHFALLETEHAQILTHDYQCKSIS